MWLQFSIGLAAHAAVAVNELGGRVERIVSYFHDDCIFWLALGPEHTGRSIVGKEAVRNMLAVRFRVIPDMHWARLDAFVAGEKRAVTMWRVIGKSADGTVLDYKGCDLCEFKHGLIWRKDTYWMMVRPGSSRLSAQRPAARECGAGGR